MELTIIGCWAAYPRMGEACSGYLIGDGDTHILVDCGHSVFSKLGQYICLEDLDAVIITHFHPDHFADLYALKHAVRSQIYNGMRNKPLKVFLPGQPANIFTYFSGKKELEVEEIRDGGKSQVGKLNMQFFTTNHTVPGFAVRVTDAQSSLFYSSDTVYSEKLVTAAGHVNLLLVEATMLEQEQEYAAFRGHMSTRDVACWGEKCKPDVLVATHFWEGYKSGEVAAELVAQGVDGLRIAREGLRLTV